MIGPLSRTESNLLAAYRESMANDQRLLESFLVYWPMLSPAQRGALCRTADLFANAAAWRAPAEKGGTP